MAIKKRSVILSKSRGQAAMEFLMTYGWAILVVLVVLGALTYVGVLNPDRLLPNNCFLMPGLDCDDFNVDATTGQVQLFIRNGLGKDIDFTTLNIDVDNDGFGDCTPIDPPLISKYELSEQINIPGCLMGGSGERFSGAIVGNYMFGGGNLEYTMSGSLISKVEGGDDLIVVP
ncbi:hypothetical protein HYX16_04980 [Candidatus Woesearchaeota archaeon]|nr:hypothetical protein [Candidatus Woesearchaeota archaeon]